MHKAATALQLLVRTTGVIQIGLGMLFWAGVATSLVPVHMLVGLVLVLGLWALSLLGLRGGANRGLATLGLVWGLIAVGLGMAQEGILTGNLHFLIQILHLGVGIAAMGLAETLAGKIKQPERAAV